MVLPLLVLFALVSVAAVGVAQARLRCADVAREAARSAARGQPGGQYAGQRSAQISLTKRGQSEIATVRLTLRPVGWLPAVTVVESAAAALEPDGGPQSDGGPQPVGGSR